MSQLRYCDHLTSVLPRHSAYIQELCLNVQLSVSLQTFQMQLCRAKVEIKKCHYYNNLEKGKKIKRNYETVFG